MDAAREGVHPDQRGSRERGCVHAVVLLTDPGQWSTVPSLRNLISFVLLLKDSPKEEMDREITIDLIKDTDPSSGKKGSSPWS